MQRRRFLNSLAAVGLALPAVASAQSAYPSRPIRIVAAFSPGTGSVRCRWRVRKCSPNRFRRITRSSAGSSMTLRL
jgi:hypothetical protein